MKQTLHLLLVLLVLFSQQGCITALRDKFDWENAPELGPLPEVSGNLDIQQLWKHGGAGDAGPLPRRMSLVLVPETGRLYANSAAGDLLALEAATGKRLWHRDLGVETHAGPGATDSLVVLGTTAGELLAQSAEGGEELWRAQLSSEILAPPKIDTGIVLTRTLDGKLFAHEAGGGGVIWSYESKVPALTLRGTSSPEVGGKQVYSGLDNGKLLALQLGSGALLWESTIAVPEGRTELERLVDIDATPQARGGHIYVITFQGKIAKVDSFRGGKVWERQLSSYSDFILGEKHVYLADEKGVIWALDQVHGLVVWQQEGLRDRRPSGPALAGNHIVVGDAEGYLYWISLADGALAGRVRLADSPVSAVPVSASSGSSGSIVYARAENGTIGAYSTP